MSDTISSDTQSDSAAETATDQAATDTQAGDAGKPAAAGLTSDERTELDKLRAVHKDERRWERRAKENFTDAEQFRELKKVLGGDSATEDFDPKAELDNLRQEIAKSNTERLRADVARVKGVDPTYVAGQSQEDMEAAADRYLADIESRVQAALQKANVTVSATESTSTVKSGDRVEGPKQITSEAELSKLPHAQQIAAYKDGRLDKMLGR